MAFVSTLAAWAIFAAMLASVGCASSAGSGAPSNNPDSGATGSGGKVGGTGGAGSGGSSAGTGGAGSGGDSAGGGGSVVSPEDASDGTPVSSGSGGGAGPDGGKPPATLGPAGGACPGGASGNPLPASPNATLVKGGFGGELEGPVWVDAQKALYFAQMGSSSTNGQINKYTPADGMFTVFVKNVGVGGLAVDQDGMLVAASYDSRTLTRFDPATAKRTDVPGGGSFNGQKFNEVNDVVVRGDGNMYFSDPNFNDANAAQGFYRLSPAPESKVSLVFSARNANGIALSPDGLWLYVATTENGGPPLRRMALAADGSVNGQGTAWKDATSDGMAVDCGGNLYLSIAGNTNMIKVISPDDQPLGNIVGLGGGYVTNSAFGDPDRKTLYITTSEAIYKIQLNVPGFPN
ncbi:MAG TPA: SMP-30/gluconolactonase/LRE family protein [Polyangia bacterium]|nr:SMP-30/gluconolactonase/LRE family protein [Polyangia bacterium]